MRRLQLMLLVGGAMLLVLVVQRVGIVDVAEKVRQTGWRFFAIVLVGLIADALHTEGWRRCFSPEARVVSRLELFLCRKAGGAVNYLTPTATIGGEAVKPFLLRASIPVRVTLASVVVDKLAFAVGQAVFLLFGVGLLFATVLRTPEERGLAALGMGLWMVGLAVFYVLQRRGLFANGARVLRAFAGSSRVVDRVRDEAASLDASISGFLRDHSADLLVSVSLHAVAQTFRILQFYLALRGLGFHPDLVACATMAAGTVFMDAILFLVPGRVGVFEGGNLLVLTSLGFDAATALGVALVLRIAEVVALAPGLVSFARYRSRAGRDLARAPARQGPPL